MTREEIIAGFHKLYLENIAAETRRRGSLRGIPIAALTKIHDDTIADYVESFLRMNGVDAGNVVLMTRS